MNADRKPNRKLVNATKIQIQDGGHKTGRSKRCRHGIDDAAAIRYREIFHGLLTRGISIAPSAYEVGFLSLAHDRGHVDTLVAALAEVID